MRTFNGFSTTFFAAALMPAVLALSTVPATAQTVPVANGYSLRYLSGAALSHFTAVDGFQGFCTDAFALGGFPGVAILQFDGNAYLQLDVKHSFTDHTGRPVFRLTRDNLGWGGTACGAGYILFFVYRYDREARTYVNTGFYSLGLGDQHVEENFRQLAAPGQPFNYDGGSAVYVDGQRPATGFGRYVFAATFDQNGAKKTMLMETFPAAPPRLLGEIGDDMVLDLQVQPNAVMATTLSKDRTTGKVITIPTGGQPFTVAQVDGITQDDLSSTEARFSWMTATTRNTTAILIRTGNHLVIQKLTAGQITPVTVLDSDRVEGFPVDAICGLALTDDNSIWLSMQTTVPLEQTLDMNGGSSSIFRLDPQGGITRVMTDGADVGHYKMTGWTVAAVGNRVIASRGVETYEIIAPR